MFTKKQRRRIRKALWLAVILIMVFVGVSMILGLLKERKPTFVRYPEFGIAIPENYSIHGIDVSKYQDYIAWEEVKNMKVKNISLGFSFIKATEGIGNTDPQFKRNWKKAGEQEMIRGAYHFFIGSKDGKMQAENFIKRVELEPGDLPPVLDVEQRYGVSKLGLQKEVKRWLQTVEEYYHVKPIIYTNVDFYNQNLGESFDDYPLWVAHYYQPEQPRISRPWIFWQHSDQGNVNGITYKVDFNVFSGDSVEFRNMLMR